MKTSLPQGNSDCVGSAAFPQTSTRIIPIMTAPSPSIGHIQQRQDASEQHPHPQTSEAHLQSSGAQLVAFHTEHERRPPEGPQRKYDATSRRRAANATTAAESEMDMDCRRPLAGQQQDQGKQAQQRHHKHQQTFWSSDGSGNTSSAEGKTVEDAGSGGSGQTKRSSNPEDWFNSLNTNVAGGNQNFVNYDDDSPYYVPRRRPDGSRHSRPKPLRAPFDALPQELRIPACSIEESNSESFRSVIDDLTIKNQKLKERLRRIKGFQGKGAQGEKLFEVRIHDLPEHKKHELDQLLKNFSASLENTSPGNDSGNNITHPDQSVAPPDSGYASLPRNQSPAGVASSSNGSKSSDPLRLWPSNTELAKMKLVVAKLEQLFTGSDTTYVDRSQLLKQQDISNSAADDDRRAAMAAGYRELNEGAREAAMMDGDGIVSDESGNNSGTDKKEASTESPEGFEQRPTRPMDLDPGRRQVPQDNIEYLTHITESSTQGPGMGNGWVFLNLIINLAQLHTINVTPPFVKKAINTVSTRLELSPDGRMVRWNAKDRESSESNSGSAQSDEGSRGGYVWSGEKDSSKNSSSGCGFGAAQQSGDSSHESKFHYKPLFGQVQFFEDDSSSPMTSSDSDTRSPSDEYGNGSRRNAGPIIYYKGGNFCTDLSSTPVSKNPLTSYKRVTDRPLGIPEKCPESPGSKRDSPLHQYTVPSESIDAMDIEYDSPSIHFSPEFTATHPSTPVPPIEFEASGVGGVLPADNFAITCQTRHYLYPTASLPVSLTKTYRSKHHRKLLHRIPQRALNSFYEPDQRPPPTTQIRHEILSAETTRLPPSSLPPASYFIPYSSSSSSDSMSEDSDDIVPRSYGSEDYFGTCPAPPSGDDENNPGIPVVAAGIMKRSPSSAATAGDESRPESPFAGVDEPTFETPLRLEESEGSSDSAVDAGRGFAAGLETHEGRPCLKRHRNVSGSVTSCGSVSRSGKSQKMMDGF